MRSSVILSLIPAAMAYNYGGSYGSSESSVEPAAAQSTSTPDGVHVVKVGQNGLTFEPAEITAAVGDTVEFHFWPMAHSVAQSSFDQPCQPLNESAFFSGPVPVDTGMSDTIFTLDIEDENPKWFYCATGNHCQSGMVGVINAPANGQKTLTQYSRAAANAEDNVAPSTTGGGTLSSVSAETTPTPDDGPSAGPQTYGSVRWGLMVSGLVLAMSTGALIL